MRATVQVALLLASCVWAIITQAQSGNQGKSSHSNPGGITVTDGTGMTEPIQFSNKAKDICVMLVSSQGNFTKLRVLCKTKGEKYRCDYLGKPNLCQAYNKNQRHYFTQIMWEMRKLQNSCQGLCTYKPHMCRYATDTAQMVFQSSWPKILTKPPKTQQPTKECPKLVTNPPKPVKTTTQRPTESPKSWADQMAEQHCWKSVQGICSFFINLFE